MSDALVTGLRVLQQRAAQKDPGIRYSFNFFACVDLATKPCAISVTAPKRGLHHVRIAEAETVSEAVSEALVWLERFTPWTPESVARTLGVDAPAA